MYTSRFPGSGRAHGCRLAVNARRWLIGGGAVTAALIVWNLGNFAFFVLANHRLSTGDFGLLQALLAATIVAFVPCGAFQMALARLANPRGIAAVYGRAWRRAVGFSLSLAAVVALGLWVIGHVVDHLPIAPLATSILVVVPMVPLVLSLGRLQGSDRMLGFASSFGTMGAPRPLAFLVLASFLPALYAGLVGSAVSMFLAATIGAFLTRRDLIGTWTATVDPVLWRRFVRALPPLFAGLVGVATLTNADVIAAELSLSKAAAGQFAGVAVLAKAVLIVPQALSLLLLPRVAARHAAGRPTGPLLAVGAGLAISGTLLAALLCIPLSDVIVRILDAKYAPAAHLLPGFVAATAPLCALTILLNHHVARSADRFVWAVGLIAVLHVGTLSIIHAGPGAIIAVDAASGVASLVAHELIHGRDDDGMVASTLNLLRTRRGSR